MTTAVPRILIVDDDVNNCFLLEELLGAEGYETVTATSGSDALAQLEATAPDLILLDIMMPQMDGFEVCQQIRARGNLQATPIIFLTALDDEQSRLRGITLTGDDYLTKPIQSSLLLAKVSSLLQLSQLRSQQVQNQLQEKLRHQLINQMSAAWAINEALSEKFRLFVPEQFLARIAPKGIDSIQVGNATETELTILFCDIRDFTAIAEDQIASETYAWLNAFFQTMNQAITTHHGFIDKYLGDAIMAVFDRSNAHANDAIEAAIAMCQALEQFNATRQQFKLLNPLKIGVGIHTGIGVIGTVGADFRMDSTVIGDVVNTASRLEELTKIYGHPVLVSKTTEQHLDESAKADLRYVDRVMLRGKQHKLDVFALMLTKALANAYPLSSVAIQQ